jgi:protein-S-isoprenylcysteine O-methyltransferase Ste14
MLVMLGILVIIVPLFVIFYEEPHLQELFGDDYERYRRNVPRWIPRLRPYQPSAVPNHP